ncbi:hypothetical protein FSP39_004632 [Pinctada imbricata]|uniref:Peptidase M12B domain-containing protein n=1 Tax=Pinctada imbricata TaxID=66713 RepID=A0AA88XTR0_PINIB|nr:hypothetical protein FSP39_004632 [Pinctada imbricata]
MIERTNERTNERTKTNERTNERMNEKLEDRYTYVSSIFIREIKIPKGAHQNVLPSSFTVTLTVRGQEVNLSLHHNAELKYIPTPIVALQKRWNGDVMRNRYVHYQDRSKLAAVEVECHDVGCTSISLFGTLFIDGELILIQKQQSNGGSSSVIYDVIHSSTNHIYHGNDYAIPSNQNKVDNTPRANKSVLDRRKRASGTYILELLLVIDYSFYKYWYDKQSTSSNQATRRAAAINDIRRYCGFFMNGTLQSSPFNKAEGLIDAETALNSFSEWMNSNSGALPAHDHAMIITSLDLFRSGSTATKGYAFLGTMCSSSSHSVVEDDFDFLSQTTAAHEIGHGLNAVHDGDSNSCLVSAGYIMAASSQVFPPSDSRRFNLWKFSTCSVNEIGAFIDTLNPNCLLRNDVSDTSGLDAYTATPIGQIYSPDTQCIYSYGTGSYFGRSFYNESTLSALCTSMYCRDPTTTNSYYIMVPGYGTSCGNNKVAQRSRRFEVTPQSTCPFGDSTGIVYDGKTCSVYIRDSPWRCYSDSVYRTCCSSCDAIRTTISGCEFGDKTDCSTITSGSGCYAGNNADVCCGTCQQYKTGISGNVAL